MLYHPIGSSVVLVKQYDPKSPVIYHFYGLDWNSQSVPVEGHGIAVQTLPVEPVESWEANKK